MKNEVIEFRPDVIEQFCGGSCYTPRDLGKRRVVRHWLLSACGATTFAAAVTTLVRFLGG